MGLQRESRPHLYQIRVGEQLGQTIRFAFPDLQALAEGGDAGLGEQDREREHHRALPLIQAEQESGTIQTDAPPALILMAVMALATAWSPAFPFGATANPATELSPGTIRDAIGGHGRPHRRAQMTAAGRGDLRELWVAQLGPGCVMITDVPSVGDEHEPRG